jgi:general secretion pathway protein D
MMSPALAHGASKDRTMKRHGLRTGFLWLAIVVASGHAWPAGTASVERSAAEGGATARSPQTGVSDANVSARPADILLAQRAATEGGATARSPQTGVSDANVSARPAGPDVVTLNFVNADIEGVVKAVSEITGRNFVLDPRVKGTINIVSAKPMSRALVYQTFLSAIRLQGFTAVEEQGVIMIVPETDAKLYAGPAPDKQRGAGDIIQTRVFKLQYESATQVMPVLRPLISPNNTITAYQNNNTLVVTDYASNLQRIEKIIGSIDQPSGTDPIMIPIRYASALDIAQTINRLFTETTQATADPTQRFTVAADARTNSLLARATDPSRILRVRQLVTMLDTPTAAGGNIHVVYLKNAEAVKMAEILREIYTGESAAGRTSTTTSFSGTTTPAATPQLVPQAPTQPAATIPGIIQADAATNSIIITAPDATYNNLRAALEKLDVRRAQVYVQALIAEVTANKAAEFGIQWQSLSGLNSSNASAFGGTNFGLPSQNILSTAQNPTGIGRGLNVGVINGAITIPGTSTQILNLNLLIRALQTDSNTNILSTPTLLTLDNEEAKIVIGQNLPFITGSYAVSAAATTPTPFQTIERKDVGLTLKLKPQISEGGTVRLQIYQEVSSVDNASTLASSSGPVTNKRSVESSVLVNDGQIVVIGGLIQDQYTDGVEKIPFLGDLPLIGGMFRYNTRTRNKTNLMVFLQPTLLRTAQQADSLAGDRYDYILGEQLKAKPLPSALPDFGTPSLPPRQGAAPAEAGKPASEDAPK